jgi:hypothetical protein
VELCNKSAGFEPFAGLFLGDDAAVGLDALLVFFIQHIEVS